jgi:polyvinyl alcohol dehydrogenase (cytochrome)
MRPLYKHLKEIPVLNVVKYWALIGMLVLLFAMISPLMHPVYAAAGDWPTYLMENGRSGYNGAETIINATTAPNLKLHWTHTAAGSISTQPVEANGLVYWGSWDGYEHATNLNNTTVWTRNLGQTTDSSCVPPKVGVASTATIGSVTINGVSTSVNFVGGGNGNFYAINATTGTIIWQTPLGSPPSHFLWSSPALYNGSIYEGMASFGDCPLVQGQLIQMNASTGQVQHIFNVVPNGCTGGGVWGSPTIDAVNNTIYMATGNAGSCSSAEPFTTALVEVSATDLSFRSSWQLPSAERVPDSDFGSTPTLFSVTINGVVHSLVGMQNKNGKFYAFDRANINTGPIWRATIAVGGSCPQCGQGGISPSAWDGKTLYVAGGSTSINGTQCKGSLRALNPASGAFIWQHCLLSGTVLGAVTEVPGVLAVGQGSYLILLSASSGLTLFRYQDTTSGALFYGAASISNGVLYIGNQDGHLYAFGP